MQNNDLELWNTKFPDRKMDMQISYVISSRKNDPQKLKYKALQRLLHV